eukprot:TRINITY_DN5510_c0_g1_i4.p2 TRINITY_DN5510_c0_g1~~TRINITY_DN5510_c0_g1_i4.p2  ORF type:complete len:101 (+),score=11.06 TRINITY_DN5510_c0_g1_i4:151-453(+)
MLIVDNARLYPNMLLRGIRVNLANLDGVDPITPLGSCLVPSQLAVPQRPSPKTGHQMKPSACLSVVLAFGCTCRTNYHDLSTLPYHVLPFPSSYPPMPLD